MTDRFWKEEIYDAFEARYKSVDTFESEEECDKLLTPFAEGYMMGIRHTYPKWIPWTDETVKKYFNGSGT